MAIEGTGDDTTWEPGAPSLRAFAPSIVGGAVVPLTVYYIVRHHVSSDQRALIIAGIFPAAWIVVQWLRTRRLDPIGAIVLIGFVVGVTASELLGGSAFVLKVRDSAFTLAFGIATLFSLLASRPLMFHIGKAMSAGDDPPRRAAYDELWELDEAKRVFRVITVCWGIGLIAEASLRIVLAAVLPTGPFLAVSPVLAFASFGGLFAFTGYYSARARRLGEAEMAAQGLAFPSVAEG
ncbi:MAG TPA: VC0807 family protein [Mycobacteriales bacterium]|nr:VC0807 family protein [Mycobacteriales bacterium]